MSFTNTVVELLTSNDKMSVNQVASATGLSLNYVRVQLRFIEQAGIIEKVDDRLPIIYKLAPNSPVVKNHEKIDHAKRALLADSVDEKNNMAVFIRKFPKNMWPEIAKALEIYSVAIKDLDADNKLIDTL